MWLEASCGVYFIMYLTESFEEKAIFLFPRYLGLKYYLFYRSSNSNIQSLFKRFVENIRHFGSYINSILTVKSNILLLEVDKLR